MKLTPTISSTQIHLKRYQSHLPWSKRKKNDLEMSRPSGSLALIPIVTRVAKKTTRSRAKRRKSAYPRLSQPFNLLVRIPSISLQRHWRKKSDRTSDSSLSIPFWFRGRASESWRISIRACSDRSTVKCALRTPKESPARSSTSSWMSLWGTPFLIYLKFTVRVRTGKRASWMIWNISFTSITTRKSNLFSSRMTSDSWS